MQLTRSICFFADTWLSRSLALLVAIICSGTSLLAAEIQLDSQSNDSIWLSGPITRGDDRKFAEFMQRLPKSTARYLLHLDSDGGDVQTALNIGRLVRKHEMRTMSRNCLSSCVFIFAGGVDRSYVLFKGDRGQGIGIHRFYFADLSPSASRSEVTAAYGQLKKAVSSYLDEMNIPQEVLTAMEAVPPGQMRFLSNEELEGYRLTGRDPVYDEQQTAEDAAYHFITSAEYRKRMAEGEARCPQVQTVAQIGENLDCIQTYLWRMPRAEVKRKTDLFYQEWRRTSNGSKDRAKWLACRRAVFIENRSRCD
jgi:hypothetical protein